MELGFIEKLFRKQHPRNPVSKRNEVSSNNIESFLKSPDAAFVSDMDGQIIGANKKFLDLLGYHQISTVNENLISNHSNRVKQHFDLAIKHIPSSFDISLIHRMGHEVPVHMTLFANSSEKHHPFVYGLCQNRSPLGEFKKRNNKLYKNLKQAQEIANMGSWDYDVEEDRALWSEQTYRIFALDAETFIPTWDNIFKYIHPLDKQKCEQVIKRAIQLGEGYQLEHRIITEAGEERVIFHHTEVLVDERGKTVRLIGILQDITSKRKMERKLTESETHHQSIMDQLSVGIWSLDRRKRQITFCSQGMKDIFGMSPSIIQKTPSDLWNYIHPSDKATVEGYKEKWINGLEASGEFRIVTKDGKVKWLKNQTIPFLDSVGRVIRIDGIIRDITNEKNYTDELVFLTNHDLVTELPNRRYFDKRLAEQIASSKQSGASFALFYLDLDRFGYINDAFGNKMGDCLLAAFSERLKDLLGPKAFLARLTGDGFVLLLKDFNHIEDCMHVATRINSEMEKPFDLAEYEFYITTSIGISIFPSDGEDSHTLLKNARSALYTAKEEGGNKWIVYSSHLNIESFKRYQLETGMHKANLNEEFYVVYQPKVHPKTGKIGSAEALIRWNHPEWGVVSPTEFIPLAEENGCIFGMEDFVFEKVLHLLKTLKKEGLPVIPISINISPKRLLKAGFAQDVKLALEQSGVEPQLIEMELTEHVTIKNMIATRKVMSELKEIGIKFALDDFGTGYSSLSYIKELQIDTLKIDISFIAGIGIDKTNEGIIKSVLFLAKELGIHAVAEGVERHDQLNFLLQQECPQIQGYIFSRPVKETEFKKMLVSRILKPTKTLKNIPPIKNRRKYFRLQFDFPLCADMTIVRLKGKDIRIGKSRTLVKDISLGGLCFLSNINMPAREGLVLQFTTTIFEKQIQFVGDIVWKLEENGLWRYGLKFRMTDKERDQFAPLFNQLLLQLKRNPLLPGCDFLRGSKVKYLETR